MNPVEKQMQLGRSLFELNAATFKRLVELDADSFRTFVDTNRAFMERVPEAKDVAAFAALQREYGESIWEGAKSAWQARGEIFRDSTTEAGELFRGAFSPDAEEAAPEAKPQSKSRAKAAA